MVLYQRILIRDQEIEIWKSDLDGSSRIESGLKRHPYNPEFNACLDTIESMILAHTAAGIEVNCIAYLEGIETVLDALENNYL